ncbi:MAG: ParA family protein [Desulfosalsimonadaceae bacterium]
MIIGFVQTKGGTGKSTLAVNTAFSGSMNRRFSSIALVELDPQGTLKGWWEERDEMGLDPGNVSFHHISSTQKEVFQQGIKSISDYNELMIMDIPGESTGKLHTRFACAFCDLVIIPMRMSTNDESAFMSNLYPIIKEIIRAVPEKKGQFHVLPVFTHPLVNLRHCFNYFEEILPAQISCLPAVFPARTVYENFNRKGFNLNEYAKLVESNKKYTQQVARAIEDIEKISQTIISMGRECDDNK